MSIREALVLVAGGALLFYCLIPLAGALFSRRSWRAFRLRFYALRASPLLDYAALRQEAAAPSRGEFRLWGTVDGRGEGSVFWVRGENVTVMVDSRGAQICRLTGRRGAVKLPAVPPEERVFVAGPLAASPGQPCFRSERSRPVILVFLDETAAGSGDLLRRVIFAGRQKLEYWNTLTPFSLVAGAFFLLAIGLAYIARPAYAFVAKAAFISIFTPLFPFLPPGLLFSIAFQQCWQKARLLMARGDRVRLSGEAGSGRLFARAALLETLSWLLFAAGMVINIAFVGSIVFMRSLW